MSEPLIVIGNGMAAARLVDELARRALGRYAVAVIGEEPRLAYNRVLLSALLADEVGFDDIELRPARWWRDRGVTLRYGVRATAVDAAARNVTLAGGTRLSFSKLVFATGSQPIKPDIPGMDLPGVLTFRDVDDVNAIAASKAAGTRVVVIGGGLLGLEAAYGLAKAGARVTLLHLMDRLMERQLDHRAALMLQRAVEARGIAVRLQAQTARISGNGGAVAQLHRLDPAVAGDAGGVRLQPDGDALGLDRALEHERRARIELALHQPVHEVEKRDSGAGLGEAVGGFEAEQPTADHHHARPCGFHCRNGVDVVHVAEGEDPGEIHAGNVGLDRLRPGGEDELGECKLRTA